MLKWELWLMLVQEMKMPKQVGQCSCSKIPTSRQPSIPTKLWIMALGRCQVESLKLLWIDNQSTTMHHVYLMMWLMYLEWWLIVPSSLRMLLLVMLGWLRMSNPSNWMLIQVEINNSMIIFMLLPMGDKP